MNEQNWPSYFGQCFSGQLRQHCIVRLICNTRSKVSKTNLLWLLPLIKDPVRLLQDYSEDRIRAKLYLSEPMEKIRENLSMAILFAAR